MHSLYFKHKLFQTQNESKIAKVTKMIFFFITKNEEK